ncbi:MAG TPA: DUF1080 domain-containing protein [Gemmataceae bacterium]|nr:DUF1080 domain-containing protein [Gemmataceae bacterium]
MRRFLLFALFALVPLACSTQMASQSAKVDTGKIDDYPPPVEVDDTGKGKGPQPNEAGWVQLFNGKDKTGWHTLPDAPGKWEVSFGVLTGSSPELSFLYSDRDDYQNFHVRMEAKASDKCDSGLFFRASKPEKAGKKGPGNPKGYEAQINNTGMGGMGGSMTGSLLIGGGGGGGKTSVSEKLVEPDAWYIHEVIADGNRIKILVNGKVTVDYTDVSTKGGPTKGHFAIQSKAPLADKADKAAKKAGKKGGAPEAGIPQIIYVRKLEIKELPPTSGK